MAKCGKGCMPECEYFTTGGCVSPFNCLYKIETGYINYATSTLDSLTDLSTEFDEMGFAPTTPCPNSEEYAIGWREKVRKEITRLKSENAELRKKLKSAMLNRNIYYIASIWNDATMMRRQEIQCSIVDYVCDKFVECNGLVLHWDEVYFTREEAEAKLKEMRGSINV